LYFKSIKESGIVLPEKEDFPIPYSVVVNYFKMTAQKSQKPLKIQSESGIPTQDQQQWSDIHHRTKRSAEEEVANESFVMPKGIRKY
jgi:hypothetical protein